MIGKHARRISPLAWGTMVLAGAVLGTAVIFAGSIPASAESPPQMMAPSMDGVMLLEMRCSTCHSAEKPKKAQKTREEWDRTVTRMMNKGAKLSDAEKTALVDYLDKTYPKTK